MVFDPLMIRRLLPSDFDVILNVINDAAQAYKGVIRDDRWKEPYMPAEELREEIESGVTFYGWVEDGNVLGVMGIQRVKYVTLIRHSYVITERQRQGIGGKLLEHLKRLAETPEILVGTWENATWAISFYQKHGFQLVSRREKDRLLREYWTIPEEQIEASVVLKYRKS
jgi:GNAT superfamily N-acetyltransferase